MSDARRTNITISESLYAKAQAMMKLRDFNDFSGYIQQLIREDWGRSQIVAGTPALNDPARPVETKPPNAERRISYATPKGKRPRRN